MYFARLWRDVICTSGSRPSVLNGVCRMYTCIRQLFTDWWYGSVFFTNNIQTVYSDQSFAHEAQLLQAMNVSLHSSYVLMKEW